MKNKWQAEPCLGKCGALTEREDGFCRYCSATGSRLGQSLDAHIRKYLNKKDPIPFPLPPDARLPCMDSELDFLADQTTDEHRTVCGGCPAKEWCLARALAYDDTGTCGGTSYQERREMKKESAA